MRIAHTADFHIGCLKNMYPQGYLIRAEHMLDELRESLIEQQVDVLLVCGDVFEKYAPSDDERTLFSQFLVQCITAQYPRHTIILPGNHDAEKDYMGALTSLEKIAEHFIPRLSLHTDLAALDVIYETVTFEDRPGFRNMSVNKMRPTTDKAAPEHLRILMVPDEWVPDFKQIGKAVGKSPDNPLEVLDENAARLYQSLRRADVVISHYAAKGSVFETGTTGGSVDIPYEHFDNTLLWCLGDIHKMQQICQAPPVWYSGTPFQKNFGESHDKGYLLHVVDPESKTVETEFIELTRATPLLTYDMPPDLDVFKAELDREDNPFQGKLIKYRYRNTAFEDLRLPGNFIVPEFTPARASAPANDDSEFPVPQFDEGFELGLDLFDGIETVIKAYCPDDPTMVPEVKDAAWELRKELHI